MLNAYNPKNLKSFPDVVKNLMIINGLFYLAAVVLERKYRIDLAETLGLYFYTSEYFRPWQLVSHMFMHNLADPMHLLLNMFGLWMFGSTLENYWGAKRFLIFYMFTGIGASLLYSGIIGVEVYNVYQAVDAYMQSPSPEEFSYLFNKYAPRYADRTFLELKNAFQQYPHDPRLVQESVDYASMLLQAKENSRVVGASGAVFGILLGFGMLFPNTELLLLFFPIPIKAKYLVTLYGALELYRGIQNDPGDNVAHFAHLGGMLFGYILIKYWNKTNRKSLY
jgi:membrane associated rhomboid family serine protease